MNEMNGNGRPQDKVRIALIGVGNCANSFLRTVPVRPFTATPAM